MKRKVRYISEIIFAVFLIFISYFAWDRIDVEAYEKYITQYNYDNLVIEVENKFDTLTYLSDKDSINDTVVLVNNYQDKVYNCDLLLELSGINDDIVKNLYLEINGQKYTLSDMYISQDDNIYSFLITNLSLDKYEKKNVNLKLLVNDDYVFNDLSSFSYNFKEEILG